MRKTFLGSLQFAFYVLAEEIMLSVLSRCRLTASQHVRMIDELPIEIQNMFVLADQVSGCGVGTGGRVPFTS